MKSLEMHSYQKKVKRVTVFLLVFGLVVVALVSFYPIYHSFVKNMDFAHQSEIKGVNESDVPKAQNPRIESPRFYGIDTKNKPYTILADVGEQSDKDSVRLTQVESELKLEDGAPLKVSSNLADVMLDKDIMNLEGNIQIEVDGEYIIKTEKAKIDYKNRDAQSDTKVELKSNNGVIIADSFETLNSYDEILFKNNVKTILYISNEKK